jgi:hypothetical protein
VGYTSDVGVFVGEEQQIMALPLDSLIYSDSRKPSICEFGCVAVVCRSRTPREVAATKQNPWPVLTCGSEERQTYPRVWGAKREREREREKLWNSNEQIVDHFKYPLNR